MPATITLDSKMDTWSHKGYLLAFSEFLELLTPEHQQGVQRDAALLCYRIGSSESRLLGRVRHAKSIHQIKQILSDSIQAKIEEYESEGDEGSDYWPLFSEDSDGTDQTTLALIQAVSRVLLPIEPERVTMMRNGRTSGWDVPLNEVVLEFSFDACFEIEPSEIGKALARAIGIDELKPSEWTSVDF
ncbi:hypothetical protein DSM3645_14630 [Blastopirellula marina DSM 3645]|uniref:Uncharacterized protein n=2 Tax=Blastopirellula marina TaxID=124 RepID=A3ZSD0_9BACT|nr:hypothetical protein DSM3645_14630 [Blastopirellula marina DSM 3645]